jgi:two-component system, chemotaxis family, sensor kinase Cph1
MKTPMNGHGKSIIFEPSAHQPNISADKTHDELEQRLRGSTAELAKAHADLKTEVSKLTRLDQALRDSERRLSAILDTNRSVIAERDDAEESLREVSGQLVRSSNAERRMALDLHDSTSPALAGVISRLYLIKSLGKLEGEASVALVDSLALAEHVAREIRNISEGLESPILDRSSLVSAIRSFAQNFEKQSGVRVELNLAAELNGLPPAIGSTLFRIVEEVLPEIQRYSLSRPAEILLNSSGQEYMLEVRHKSRKPVESTGLLETAASRLGIKLAGPRDRLRELGGDLEISADSGIAVRAVVPMHEDLKS